MFSGNSDPEDFDASADHVEETQNPTCADPRVHPQIDPQVNSSIDPALDPAHQPASGTTPNPKRNSGRTGPTSSSGRTTSSRNATRHGMCATTLILNHESEADWLQLLHTWLDGYQNPAENSLLYTFVLKTAQAEWFRLRAQREYDFFLHNHGHPPITGWEPFELKAYELVQRYLTAAERKFQRDYRLLEHHWKSHHKVQPETRKTARHQPDPEPPPPMPRIRFINNETGESVDCQGNEYPPPPGYVSKPIIPGVYGPKHPAYEPPNDRKRAGNEEANTPTLEPSSSIPSPSSDCSSKPYEGKP